MARSHATLSTSVWTDEDHRSLSLEAQWLYAYLLANPKMSFVGVLDLAVGQWARQAPNATRETVCAALDELVAVGHVRVDWDTDEVMFRSFTKNDLRPGRWNRNLTAGFWRAWRGVLSEDLRAQIVTQCPRELWSKIEGSAPDEAQRFRRSPRLEPLVGTLGCDPGSESPSPSPSPFTLHPRSSTSQSEIATLSTGVPA